jgi:SAM-dependent methyltransferase
VTAEGPGGREAVPASILDEQLAYYRARAPEYDQWFLRRGRYDRGDDRNAAWHAELAQVRSWLVELVLEHQDVLELAPGTGLWTQELLAAGATVTAVDAAPEMLDALRRRCTGSGLTVILADLFDWSPPRQFDVLVGCFFMSHVPDERFDAFLALVASSVRPRGRLFLLDGLREATSTARDHVLSSGRLQTMQRRLDDGRSYEIVKVFRDDDELISACARAGLDVEVRRTPSYFHVVEGRRLAAHP